MYKFNHRKWILSFTVSVFFFLSKKPAMLTYSSAPRYSLTEYVAKFLIIVFWRAKNVYAYFHKSCSPRNEMSYRLVSHINIKYYRIRRVHEIRLHLKEKRKKRSAPSTNVKCIFYPARRFHACRLEPLIVS